MQVNSKVLEFIESMESCDSEVKISDILVNAFDYLGFDSLAAVKLPGPNESLEDSMLINTRSSLFATIYYEQGFDTKDPVIEQFSVNSYAYTWSSAYEQSEIKDRTKLLNLAQDYKMNEGIVIPIPQLNAHGLISAATSQKQLSSDIYHAGYLLGMSGFCRLMATKNKPTPEYETLHPREIECLQWIAVGKSDKDISELIKLSPFTIKNYVESAKNKLGAPNRTAAAVMALRAGLIHP